MKTTLTLPPIEIFDVLRQAETKGIPFPREVAIWWNKEYNQQQEEATPESPPDEIIAKINRLREENKAGTIYYDQPAAYRIERVLDLVEQVYNELSDRITQSANTQKNG